MLKLKPPMEFVQKKYRARKLSCDPDGFLLDRRIRSRQS